MKNLSLEDISPFRGATDTPVLDFWWRLPWVSKPGWIPCMLSRLSDPQIHLWCDTCWTSWPAWQLNLLDPCAHKHWWRFGDFVGCAAVLQLHLIITRNEREVVYAIIHMDTNCNAILFIDTPTMSGRTMPIGQLRSHVSPSFLMFPLLCIFGAISCLMNIASGGSSGRGCEGRPTPLGQNFFIYRLFSGKICQIVGGRPLAGWHSL